MDFRNSQPQAGHQPVPATNPAAPVSRQSKKWDNDGGSRWFKTAAVALLFCVTVLAVATIGVIALTTDNDQNKLVKSADYQAVFLTNGQVYFGNITTINKDYIQLQNIYYLTQNTSTDAKGNTTTNGNYTLVKLGCQQIHDPFDQMVIERSQVSFWENLQGAGKVVTSINQFIKQNPKGPDCSQVSNQTQASGSTTTQGSNTTATTPSTSTTSTTPTTSR